MYTYYLQFRNDFRSCVRTSSNKLADFVLYNKYTHNFKSLILMQHTIVGTYDDCRYFEMYVILSNKSGKFITS